MRFFLVLLVLFGLTVTPSVAQAPVQLNECNETGSPPRVNCVQTGVLANPLIVTPSGGSGSGSTGGAVPSTAVYTALNVGGFLRGWTGVNPTGTTYAGQVDITSVNGSATTGGTVPVASLATSSIIGAVSQARVMAAATTNATSVAATPGNLYGRDLCNTTASAAYLKLYDLAAAPTVGTSTPIVTWLIPAGGCLPVLEGPISFVNGIAYAITAGVADADTTAVALNSVVGYLPYKAQ